MKRSYLLIIVIVLFTAVTLYLTLVPGHLIELPSHVISHDKIGHFLLFGGWTFLIGYYRFLLKPKHPYLLIIFAAGVFFGGAVEGLQGIMPFGRDPSVFDWIADTLGALLAILLLYTITDVFNKQNKCFL